MASVDDEGGAEFLHWAAELGITDVPRCCTPPISQLDVVSVSSSSSSSTSASCCSKITLGYSLSIAYFPDAGGRGLMATRAIEEGELILRVPKLALMSVLSAREDPQLAKAISSQPELSSNQILVVHLLNEVAKRKLSPWYIYLVQLPRRHHTLAHFSQSAVDALQIEDAIWAAKNAAALARMDWEGAKGFMAAVDLKNKFRSFSAWLWASATVSSRSLYVPWDSAGTLCPVGDLFNYAPPGELYLDDERPEGKPLTASNCSEGKDPVALDSQDDFSCAGVTLKERLRDGGYDSEYGEYCFYARKAYTRGEQVLLCYGQYNNLDLLEHYGFCMTQNPNDVVYLRPPESADWDHPVSDPNGGFYVGVSGTPSFSLLARMRLHHVQPSLRKVSRYTALRGEQLSIESDVLANQWLREQCKSLLACLPTSLDDDLVLAKMLGSAQNVKSLGPLYTSMTTANRESGYVSFLEPNANGLSFISEKVMEELEILVGVLGFLENGLIRIPADMGVKQDVLFEQWKLALEWRLGYKRILHRCDLMRGRKIKELLKS